MIAIARAVKASIEQIKEELRAQEDKDKARNGHEKVHEEVESPRDSHNQK